MRILATLLLCLSGWAVQAQSWMRYPSVSPDGSRIAFTYKGNLYVVPSSGGQAMPLTFHEAHDYMPVWSPDGSQIAFASDRFGNFDVFLMPAQGGEAKRLTAHSANELPYCFTPDGKQVVFGAARMDAATNRQFPSRVLTELYSVPATGGKVTQLLTTPAEDVRIVGSRLFYHDKKGSEDQWRKHHTSSITRDIWAYDMAASTHTKLTTFKGEDRNPVPVGNELYYLSEESGTFNVHRMSLAAPGANTKVTQFTKHPVRFLSAANDGTLCFGFNGEIYTLKPGGNPQKVNISIITEATANTERTLSITDGAREFAVSPSGKEIAFVVRGEVFVTSVDGGITKRITNTPTQERSISFSPDGRSILYAAERDGSWKIYQSSIARKEESYFFHATLIKEEAVIATDKETFQPAYSPDGKEIAYLEERTTLKVYNTATKASRVVLPSSYTYSHTDGDQYFQWSPDGKWLLVNFLNPGYWIREVGLVSADGKGAVINLTQSGYDDSRPKWVNGGKMMLWFSNRDGLRSYATSGTQEADVYGMFFTQEAYDRFRLSKEEFALLKEKEEKDKKDSKETATTAPLRFDWDGLQERKAKLTIHSSRLSDAVLSKDGEKLYYITRFEKGYDLWSTNLRTRETKMVLKLDANNGGQLQWDKEQKNLFLLSDGKLAKIDPEAGKREGISFNGEMNLNLTAERQYLFEHLHRQVKKKFYKSDLHGADWESLGKEYAAYLPHISNNYELSEMFSELLGELNASHTGARYGGAVVPNADATASLGAFYDQNYNGNGLKIVEIMEKSPLISAGSKIKVGHIIEQIDGVAITPQMDYAQLLNRKAGKYTLLSILDPTTNTRYEETVKPISMNDENELLYRRWVTNNRNEVEKLSGGKIGYVHVRGMNDPSYRTVYEEVLGRLATKQAVVIDTRFNGGGDLVSDLATFLSGRKFMDYATEERSIGLEPSSRWTKPSVVLAGESNYSDAHCFPFAYKELGIGKLIGMPVPGTCTFVWWENMQDPTITFGIPNLGVADPRGNWLENTQLYPDIEIANEYGTVAQGRDQQLEKAVETLLKELK